MSMFETSAALSFISYSIEKGKKEIIGRIKINGKNENEIKQEARNILRDILYQFSYCKEKTNSNTGHNLLEPTYRAVIEFTVDYEFGKMKDRKAEIQSFFRLYKNAHKLL